MVNVSVGDAEVGKFTACQIAQLANSYAVLVVADDAVCQSSKSFSKANAETGVCMGICKSCHFRVFPKCVSVVSFLEALHRRMLRVHNPENFHCRYAENAYVETT